MIDPWLIENLVCPDDRGPLQLQGGDRLVSRSGHVYPIVDGVPIMLPPEVKPTIDRMENSKTAAPHDAPWYLDSVLVSDQQREGIRQLIQAGSVIDPVAAYLVGATNGIAYLHMVGKLDTYPIPAIRLTPGAGKLLLDIGCSWGRWSIAAAQRGYRVVGLDPSLGAVMAAKRVSNSLGVSCTFVVGDARYLPFRNELFEQTFSYSVLQHLSYDDAALAFAEIGRVLVRGGQSLIQMPTKAGIRCLYNQWRRGFAETKGFEVRYWGINQLLTALNRTVGSSTYSVDCYFGIGWQLSDLQHMPQSYRAIIRTSELLRKASNMLPPLKWFADSIYIHSSKSTDTCDDLP